LTQGLCGRQGEKNQWLRALAAMPEGTAAPQLRILLAEEQAAPRDLVKLVLGRLHHRIESVASGAAALERARHEPADLVLISTTLPDMPGAPLIGALREVPELETVPIVAIYQGGLEVRQACIAAGAAACLSRPLEIERLLRVIERLVGHRARAGAPAPEPVVDLDHLRQFTDRDPQLEGELSALFLSTAEVYLQDMHAALREGPPGPRPRTRSKVRAPISARAASRRWRSWPSARSRARRSSRRSRPRSTRCAPSSSMAGRSRSLARITRRLTDQREKALDPYVDLTCISERPGCVIPVRTKA
jgi:CheY-like chemotaxis protein